MFYLISHNTRFVNKILYFPVFSYVITNTTGYEFSRSYQVRSHSYSAHSLQTMTHCTQSDRSSMSFRTQNSHTKRKQNIHTPPHRTEQGRRCFYFYTLYLPKVCVCACVFKHKHTHTLQILLECCRTMAIYISRLTLAFVIRYPVAEINVL